MSKIKKVSVYRDNNKNTILDYDKTTISKGMFGINIHRSNQNTESVNVEKWSAGCQVFKNPNNFNDFISICKKSSEIYGNKFTYTLLTYKDLYL